MKILTFLKYCAAATAVALAGCAAPPRLATQSGNPEVVITGVPKKQVEDRLVSKMLGLGFQVRSVNEYAVTVGKPIDSPMLQALYGSQYNHVPELRHTYSFADGDGTVRVLGRAAIVTNPGSPFEKSDDLTVQLGADLQKGLEQLAASLRKAP